MHFVRRAFYFPKALDNALLEALWGRLPQAKQLKQMGLKLQKLWPILAKKRGQAGQTDSEIDAKIAAKGHYSFDRQCAEAYGAYYLPANIMKLPLVLEEMRQFGIDLWDGLDSELKWVDIGCGPGTGFWGLNWWASNNEKPFQYIGLDQSKLFLKNATIYSKVLKNFVRSRSFSQFEQVSLDKLDSKLNTLRPNVVSLLNSIDELFPEKKDREVWLESLVEGLKRSSRKDKKPRWILIIEPGSKVASRDLLETRKKLIELGVKIWLPCLDERPCGALVDEEDWCHEQARCVFPKWFETLGSQANLNKDSVLFSYLLCSVGEVNVENFPVNGSRVVSHRVRQKGMDQCYLCMTDGKKKVRVIKSRKNAENKKLSDPVYGQVFESVELDEKNSVLKAVEAENVGMDLDTTVFPKQQ